MRPATVLIIDNSGDSALGAARVLMAEGLNVLAAKSAARAQKMIASIKPALILADRSVEADPRVWVAEAARLDIPAQVIALTRTADFDEAMDWVADGVFQVLTTPLNGDRLRCAAFKALALHETFQELTGAADPARSQALAAFYQGLAGQLDVQALTDYVVRSLKTLTRAARVEVKLAPALTDSLYCFETHTFSGPRETAPAPADGRAMQRRLDFELSIKGSRLGELFLYFEDTEDLSRQERAVMLEITQSISNALRAVDKYQKAVNLAAKDGLTGLYNRRIFNEVLKREFAKARRHRHSLSLLSLDLDHFKAVNDNFGHQTGDLVLKAVAKVIAQVARNTDLPARVGGEEFAIILPHTNQDQALFLASRLRKMLEESGFTLDGAVFHQTVSQGVVDNEHFLVNSPDDMVYWADQALYLAKREGRDTIRLATELSINPVTKDRPYAFQ